MDLIEVIKGCTTVEEIEALEWLFDFEERHKQAALFQRIIILSNALERDLENERCGISTVLMDGWSDEQRESFKRDWNDDSFLAEMDDGGQAPEPAIPSLIDESFRTDWNDDSFMAELEDISDVSGEPSIPEVSIQNGEGSRKRAAKPSTESIPSKRSKTVPLFTIKSVKQVRVKKFKTTGLDYRVQFGDLQVQGLPDVLRQLHNVFESLLDRVTDGIAMHDQVRFIMHSPQLEYPISLAFMPRERLTVERILAEIERVIQSNDSFKLDDSTTVNIIHVEMPHGGTGRKRKIANLDLDKYLTNKRAIVRIQNKDDLCLSRAIVVAKAKVDNDERYPYIKNTRGPL